MEVGLAGLVAGVPERYVPDLMRGELVEAEHLSRYWWVAPLLRGRRVLDAGCGVGYGAVILRELGAREVVGVDIAEPVVDVARSLEQPGVRFEQGDLRGLTFEDASFDAVVSFEAIEHVDEPETAIAELARVLAPEGLLAVSSPNPAVYPAGNPHHRRELLPEELARALRQRFANVRLFRQDTWVLSAILDPDAAASADAGAVTDITVRTAVAGAPGPPLYTVALASNAVLPEPLALGALTHPLEPKRWLEHVENQARTIAEQSDRLAELTTLEGERRELLERLAEAERLLARLPDLEHQLTERRHERSGGWESAGAGDTIRAGGETSDEALEEAVRELSDVRVRLLDAERVAREDQAELDRSDAELRLLEREHALLLAEIDQVRAELAAAPAPALSWRIKHALATRYPRLRVLYRRLRGRSLDGVGGRGPVA